MENVNNPSRQHDPWESPSVDELEFLICDSNYPNKVISRSDLDGVKGLLQDMIPSELSSDKISSLTLKVGMINAFCSSEVMAETVKTDDLSANFYRRNFFR
jgi:hypothetical protein